MDKQLGRERVKSKNKVKITWGQYEYFDSEGLRTTLTLESWHRQLNTIVNKKGTTFENMFKDLYLKQGREEKFIFEKSLDISTIKKNVQAFFRDMKD